MFTVRISIHAPTRGATVAVVAVNGQFQHFNPRSHKGSDEIKPVFGRLVSDFNPRSHKGSDVNYIPALVDTEISIHAPTRGATAR